MKFLMQAIKMFNTIFFDGEKNPSEKENVDFKWPVLLCFLNQRRFE